MADRRRPDAISLVRVRSIASRHGEHRAELAGYVCQDRPPKIVSESVRPCRDRPGRAGVIADDIENLTGVAPRAFRDWCERHADDFNVEEANNVQVAS